MKSQHEALNGQISLNIPSPKDYKADASSFTASSDSALGTYFFTLVFLAFYSKSRYAQLIKVFSNLFDNHAVSIGLFSSTRKNVSIAISR